MNESNQKSGTTFEKIMALPWCRELDVDFIKMPTIAAMLRVQILAVATAIAAVYALTDGHVDIFIFQ